MESMTATTIMNALAQETRLAVFRLLVRHTPDGLPAGEIATRLGVPHNTLSAHLNVLSHAELTRSQRRGRSIIYSVKFATVRRLLTFLLEDCCQGQSDICAPLIDAVMPTNADE